MNPDAADAVSPRAHTGAYFLLPFSPMGANRDIASASSGFGKIPLGKEGNLRSGEGAGGPASGWQGSRRRPPALRSAPGHLSIDPNAAPSPPGHLSNDLNRVPGRPEDQSHARNWPACSPERHWQRATSVLVRSAPLFGRAKGAPGVPGRYSGRAKGPGSVAERLFDRARGGPRGSGADGAAGFNPAAMPPYSPLTISSPTSLLKRAGS